MQTVLQCRILDPRIGTIWPLPQYGTPGDAAMDLRAAIDVPLVLEPGHAELIPSGLAIHVADPTMCAVILPRSGLGHKHGLVMGNGTGVIDSGYTGPLLISAFNRSDVTYKIDPGDRIAQLMILPIVRATLQVVSDFAESIRGAGGFGHTGVR